ncbi:winged helix-turn-helix transcriptional regulator [Pseudonocardia sp. CA-107938]|uniref:winged helix-turn-helix transcriptional regulator n=1 Tax=Pseudonocardia sp. CA-107938 TaxID=3240021 RepID=UPI003D91BDA3
MSRTYGQACPVAHTLDVIGDRWAMLVLRDLRLGPKRFSDLAAGLPGIAPSVLTQRLRDLVAHGVLERRERAATVYALTPRGRDLEPVFRALADWGMGEQLDGVALPDPAALGLRRAFRPSGPPWTATLALRIGRESYTARVVDGELATLERGEGVNPDAVLTGTPEAVHAAARGTRPEEAGLVVTGDRAVADRFLGHFSFD